MKENLTDGERASRDETPRWSLVVPAGRARPVDAMLPALRALIRETPRLEIVWVSPHPGNGLPTHPAFRPILTRMLGPPGAMRNRGAAEARGALLLFLDDDCIPPPDWPARMAAVLDDDPRLGAVGCRYQTDHAGWLARSADHALFPMCTSSFQADRPFGSAAMAVRATAFRQIGGFDAELRASEDWDFGLRLLSRGWRVRYDPAIVVAHLHARRTLGAILRSAYTSGRHSALTVQQRHLPQVSRWSRLFVRLRHPALYPLIVPADTALQVGIHLLRESRRTPSVLLYAPVCLAARLAYHAGVWRRLVGDPVQGTNRPTSSFGVTTNTLNPDRPGTRRGG